MRLNKLTGKIGELLDVAAKGAVPGGEIHEYTVYAMIVIIEYWGHALHACVETDATHVTQELCREIINGAEDFAGRAIGVGE
jgi:hypothetical protein